jgi:hypothetical protein
MTVWNGFWTTYARLISIDDFNPDPLIHLDSVRLSRYINLLSEDEETRQQHIRRIERVLHVFSRYTSPIGYSQGFHELLAPFYYVVVTGGTALDLSIDLCESISYFLLHALINGAQIGDLFLTDLIISSLTVMCENATKMLKGFDSGMATLLETKNITFLMFAIPWITILFAQAYHLPQLLQLWDFLFSDLPNIRVNMTALIVAHVVSRKNIWHGRTFAQMMTVLANVEIGSDQELAEICCKLQLIRRVSD